MSSLKVLVLFAVISSIIKSSFAQVYYEISPIKAHFSFYKNGESLYVLNDSIKTSFFKKNDSTFSIRFFINGKFKQECYCEYKGITRQISVRMLVSEKGKKFFRREKRTVKELLLTDRSCIDFLPEDVFNQKEDEKIRTKDSSQ